MIKILASDGMEKGAVAALEAKGCQVDQQFYDPEALKEAVKNYDVLVVRSATKVRAPHIDAAKEAGKLKLVIRGGVGVVSPASPKRPLTREAKASSEQRKSRRLGRQMSPFAFVRATYARTACGAWEATSSCSSQESRARRVSFDVRPSAVRSSFGRNACPTTESGTEPS